MMRKFWYGTIAALCVVCLASCDKEDDAKVLSKEAAITSFTFDPAVEANAIVTSQPVINGNTITFTVDGLADAESIDALKPTIKVSEGAYISSFSGSFNLGMTYTVTAEDGMTQNTYTANCTGSIFDVYSGVLEVALNGTTLVAGAPYNISLEKQSDTELMIYIRDFTITIESMATTSPVGDVEIICTVAKTAAGYTFNGSKDLGVIEVPILGNTVSAHCVVNVENASVVGGTFTLPMKIDVLDGALTVDANFVGTPMQVE